MFGFQFYYNAHEDAKGIRFFEFKDAPYFRDYYELEIKKILYPPNVDIKVIELSSLNYKKNTSKTLNGVIKVFIKTIFEFKFTGPWLKF